MNNLALYKKVCQLKDYLEVSEFENFNSKQITEATNKINEVFVVLDRRADVMRKRFGRGGA